MKKLGFLMTTKDIALQQNKAGWNMYMEILLRCPGKMSPTFDGKYSKEEKQVIAALEDLNHMKILIEAA